MAAWKYYCYKFFADNTCVYVGKGSGKRFNVQARRFKEFQGHIVAYFSDEKNAYAYEKAQILELAPPFNKALMPEAPEPWKFRLLPEDKDFYAWSDAIGTRAMAARVLLNFRQCVDPSKLDRIRAVAGYG